MKHIVMFSGGIASWMAAKRVAEEHGTEDLILLFADTGIEDEDLYRFLEEAAANVGGTLIRLKEGRTPWEVFRDVKYMGNSRVDPCSRVLKRDLIRKMVEDNYSSDETIIYMGMDWTEGHRLTRTAAAWDPWVVKAPMMEKPLMMKEQMMEESIKAGIDPPRLYDMGFPHNNCGGFCVKAGQAHFALLLERMPERYAEHEVEEAKFQKLIGKPVTVMRDRSGKKTTPLSMKEFRERQEQSRVGSFDDLDWGGCGCFVEN